MTDMLHNKTRKSKGENCADFKYLHARNDASKRWLAGQFTSKKLDRITVFHDLQRLVAIMKAGNPVQNDL
jgi:hypothetical protein